MPWFGVLPPSEHYWLDYVHYSLLGNTVRVRIPAGCFADRTLHRLLITVIITILYCVVVGYYASLLKCVQLNSENR